MFLTLSTESLSGWTPTGRERIPLLTDASDTCQDRKSSGVREVYGDVFLGQVSRFSPGGLLRYRLSLTGVAFIRTRGDSLEGAL